MAQEGRRRDAKRGRERDDGCDSPVRRVWLRRAVGATRRGEGKGTTVAIRRFDEYGSGGPSARREEGKGKGRRLRFAGSTSMAQEGRRRDAKRGRERDDGCDSP